MLHRLYQTLTVVRDATAGDMALELVLAEPDCIAARLLTERGAARVQAFWRAGRVVAEVSDEVLASCRRGDGWHDWRQTLCCTMAVEHARLLTACGKGVLDAAEEAARKAADQVYGAGEPRLRKAIMSLAELRAVHALGGAERSP